MAGDRVMDYPSLADVELADHMTLARWHRFLQSPGLSAIDRSQSAYEEARRVETAVMNRIQERFTSMGGMTPEISKAIRW